MTPEEIVATKVSVDTRSFEARLSGVIHTAGSLLFYILTGGLQVQITSTLLILYSQVHKQSAVACD